MMRILQLGKFYPPDWGGIESVTHELTEGLNFRGYETDVLCCSKDIRTRREPVASGYSVVRAGRLGELYSTSISPSLVHELAKVHADYDVLHVHLPNPMANLALQLVRPKSRVVLHWHSDVVRQVHAHRIYAPLERWMLNRADAVIASSERYLDASDSLSRFSRKVTVIPYGIGDPCFDARSAGLFRSKIGSKRLIFALGRMIYYKGFDILVEAAGMLPKNYMLIIGGGGELLDQRRRQVAELGLSEQVVLTGPLSSTDALLYMKACDVFCLPSVVRSEAFGIVLLEAMAAGKPVVATDIDGSGVPWVNLDKLTGLNVPVNNPRALAEALVAVLDNDEIADRYGDAARRRYLGLFTAERMIAQTAALYDGLEGAPNV